MIALTHILVATDFGDASDAALRYGRELAAVFSARLDVLHVADDVLSRGFGAETYVANYAELQRDIDGAARRQVEALLDDDDRKRLHARPVVVTARTPAAAIVTYAKDERVDLIVMGTHGRGAMAHLFMGSVAERVVRTAPCPVLTVRHPEREFVRPDALAVVTTRA